MMQTYSIFHASHKPAYFDRNFFDGQCRVCLLRLHEWPSDRYCDELHPVVLDDDEVCIKRLVE